MTAAPGAQETGAQHRGTASSTASADEIARFSRIAASWWDPEGEFRPLHQLNPLRVDYICERMARHFGRDPDAPEPLSGLDLLDIGCGGGLVAEPMVRLGARVVAIDASADTVRVAQLHAEQQGLAIDYRVAAPEELAGEGLRFDIVLAMEVVEHVTDLSAFLGACSELLRRDGAMALATLNRTLKSLALAKVGAEYVLRWLPVGTHEWRKFVRPSELARNLAVNGLSLEHLIGARYDPLQGRWSRSSDLAVNYMGFARKSTS